MKALTFCIFVFVVCMYVCMCVAHTSRVGVRCMLPFACSLRVWLLFWYSCAFVAFLFKCAASYLILHPVMHLFSGVVGRFFRAAPVTNA